MAVLPRTKAKRKSLSKKTRFEVFKRDSFTCQYCGVSAPDAVLCVDHINPVAGGGEDDILNLITSCEPCNQGKGARTLDDNSAVTKQKAQLDELNKRREQLEMMLEWREGLASLDDQQIDAFDSEFSAATSCHLNDYGRSMVKKWFKYHSLSDLLDGLEAALETYYKGGSEDGDENNRLAGDALNMTVRVLNARKKYAGQPHMKDLFYARACLRNRGYCNENMAITLLRRAFELGAGIEELKDWAKTAKNWTVWRNEMDAWIEALEVEPVG